MKKILIIVLFLFFACGSSKPSWEYKKAPDTLFEAVNIKDNPKVTKNDKTILGVLFSGMILFVLHTATKY
tara:strand:+ start:901 stop:1110 length:210 start_codon:yes stop_codon:yes gene_type:complete